MTRPIAVRNRTIAIDFNRYTVGKSKFTLAEGWPDISAPIFYQKL